MRTLTRAQVDMLTDGLCTSKRAAEWDEPDFVEWMLYTGCRIGEAQAVRDASLDLEHKKSEVNATLVWVKGEGLQIQPHHDRGRLARACFA